MPSIFYEDFFRWQETPKEMVCNVVYKVPCSICEKSYICQTERYLTICVKEHKRDVTNCLKPDKHKNKPYSPCCWHTYDFNASRVLRKETILDKWLLHEMIGIKLENNSLNKRTDIEFNLNF